MVPTPPSFVSRRGRSRQLQGGLEVYRGCSLACKSGPKGRYVVTDGVFNRDTAILNEKMAILSLIA
jgi:hypothetical protein